MGAKLGGSGGGGKRGRPSPNVEPNIIPFIDVMLVLLIIFMVAAPLATVDVNVSLAPSEINPSKRPPKPVFISLQRDGKTYLGNDPINTWDIPVEIGEAVKKANPRIANNDELLYSERVYVRADGDVPYRDVMRVMNRVQDGGFFKVGLVAEDRR
jgi:biopolymer transport protein ExbD